jgi:glycosyltransferase involved in cell wall biosynthesis
MKRLAVLMPTFNYENYITESIHSILNQTFTDFDLYIYDDGSTDNSQARVKKIVDSRIIYRLNENNLGLSVTLNLGLSELLDKYEYIARMDSDDMALPERFKKQIEFLDNNTDYGLCGTQGFWLSDFNSKAGNVWSYPCAHHELIYELLFSAGFGHSSILFRSAILKNYHLSYSNNLQSTEDWDLWIRMSKVTKIANLPDFLMNYRIHSTSNHRSNDKLVRHFKERSKLIAAYWNSLSGFKNTQEVITSNDIEILYYSKELGFDYELNNEIVRSSLLRLIKSMNKLGDNIYLNKRFSLQLIRILENKKATAFQIFSYFNKLEKKDNLFLAKRVIKKLLF